MRLVPDWGKCFLDPFAAQPTLKVFCTIYEPISGDGYGRCPRTIALRAEEYVKKSGIADTAYFGPEAEFFVFGVVGEASPFDGCVQCVRVGVLEQTEEIRVVDHTSHPRNGILEDDVLLNTMPSIAKYVLQHTFGERCKHLFYSRSGARRGPSFKAEVVAFSISYDKPGRCLLVSSINAFPIEEHSILYSGFWATAYIFSA